MARFNFVRAAAAITIALSVAVVLAMQAASAVLVGQPAVVAFGLSLWSGQGREQMAFARFSDGVTSVDQMANAASAARQDALSALAIEPYATEAHVILALSQTTAEEGGKLVELAAKSNKRVLSLQGLLLQDQLAASDAQGAIETLDKILRVHTARRNEFYQVLVKALVEDATVPVFAETLSNKTDWHEGFLYAALSVPEALPNLALLRPQIEVQDERIDRLLISRLAREGEPEKAAELYRLLSEQNQGGEAGCSQQWTSRFPPFDWALADESGFRAQASRDGSLLEVYVRSGKGGAVASRVFELPGGSFQVTVRHSDITPRQAEGARLKVACITNRRTLLDETLQPKGSVFEVPDPNSECDYALVQLFARAWTGSPAFTFEIEHIGIDS
ncbi:hypothetical protein FGU71_05820 [Erythrobacter insulae]|uniref:Tetratricopeptide repeat protein n=1 Tax=Erythrobacter insulae TaxID=2584124 RepID=A0A547PBA0_9SPHN|nr:hypothetical protein [Erythrobacter insulae]TRD11420.1 hypothetical protein FGU71_05820 [Erythrobacter insulae]